MRPGRAALAAALALLLLAAPGCGSVEVNRLGIILAAGFDRRPDGRLLLALQVARPATLTGQAGGGGGGGGGGGLSLGGGRPGRAAGGSTLLLSAVAPTFADALQAIQSGFPRRLFWGETSVVLFGAGLLQRGVGEALDFLDRQPAMRLTAYVLAARKPVEQVLAAGGSLEETGADELSRELRQRVGVGTRLWNLEESLLERGLDAVADGVTVTEEGGRPRPRLESVALFRGDRLAGWLGPDEAQGLLWLRNALETVRLTVAAPAGAGSVSLQILRARSQLALAAPGEPFLLRLRVRGEMTVSEVSGAVDPVDPGVAGRLEAEADRRVAAAARAALAALQRLGADGAGFGRIVASQDPAAWRALRATWPAPLGRVRLQPDVRITLLRAGPVAPPLRDRLRGG